MALANKFCGWNNDGTGYFCSAAFAQNMLQTIEKKFIGIKAIKLKASTPNFMIPGISTVLTSLSSYNLNKL